MTTQWLKVQLVFYRLMHHQNKRSPTIDEVIDLEQSELINTSDCCKAVSKAAKLG